MLKWTGSNKVQVGVDKWFESGFMFTSLYLREVIGGTLAIGKIRMNSDGSEEALKMITEQNDIDLVIGNSNVGDILTIHGIITKRDYFDSSVVLDFECMPDINFFKRKTIMTYDDIDVAIESLWKGNIENRTQTDLPTGIKFHQTNEFDIDYLRTLCKSYKKDTIFALGLNGLLIKDLIGIDSTGNNEPYQVLASNGGSMSDSEYDNAIDNYSLFYNNELYLEPEDFSSDSLYFDTRVFNERYRLIGKDYSVLRENLFNNQKLYNSRMYNQITLVKNDCLEPTYRLGDVVKFTRPGKEKTNVPWEVYIISGISYYISTEPDKESDGKPFRQEYTLHCLQEKGETMPGVGKDPMDS